MAAPADVGILILEGQPEALLHRIERLTASTMISGPMPSPGRTAMLLI